MTVSEILKLENFSLNVDGERLIEPSSLTVKRGEVLALVGRSGVGKSMTGLAVMGLLPKRVNTRGVASFDGENLLGASEARLCEIRGGKIGMIFQEPMTALNPLQTIGAQVAETIALHQPGVSAREAKLRARETLARVGLPETAVPDSRYPHELSGGQRQRVVIAIAIAMHPALLIADEPTTALDSVTSKALLELLLQLAREQEIAVLLITHDLGVISSVADRVAVIKNRMIEPPLPIAEFDRRSADRVSSDHGSRPPEGDATPVMQAVDISCRYAESRGRIGFRQRMKTAVNQVSLSLARGEIVGLVGESGCGKSTLTRALAGLQPLAAGNVIVDGEVFASSSAGPKTSQRKHVQIVFQDPYSSFNPRKSIEDIVAEPLFLESKNMSREDKRQRVAASLTAVGLQPGDADKYPHEFSGGQRQRIALARALIINPSVVLLDEPTSALDFESQENVLRLIQELARNQNSAFLLVTHDLGVVRRIADRVLVMKNGEIIERGSTEEIFSNPQSDYTRLLLSTVPQRAHENRTDIA